MIEVVAGFLAEGLSELPAVGDLRGVNTEEADAEPGQVRGDGHDGITIAHALDGGGEGAGGGGVGGGWKEQEEYCKG